MKKQIKSKEDIIYYVAKENGVSEELVDNVYDNLWFSVRHYLSHPLECGAQLTLDTFMKFMISEGKTHQYVRRLREGTGYVPENKKDIEFYEKLFEMAAGETFDERHEKIKQRENGKRQTKEKD